jgi:hypothetical protein
VALLFSTVLLCVLSNGVPPFFLLQVSPEWDDILTEQGLPYSTLGMGNMGEHDSVGRDESRVSTYTMSGGGDFANLAEPSGPCIGDRLAHTCMLALPSSLSVNIYDRLQHIYIRCSTLFK